MKKCLDILLDALFAIFGLIGKIFRFLHREREAVPTTSASVNPVISNISEINLPEPNTMPAVTPTIASETQIPEKQVDIPITKKQAFIKALRIVVADKFDPLIVFTQCYHETDNFRKLVGEWNYCGCKFPQKAIPPVPIKTIGCITHEVINGSSKTVQGIFADFNSADDFMIFYVWQIKRLYKTCYENRNNPHLFFYGLTHDIYKWATDISYSEKLIKLYAHLKANGIERQLDRLLIV